MILLDEILQYYEILDYSLHNKTSFLLKVITVGIGPEIDRNQLNDIASDPDEEHVFTADYDSLATIIGRTQRAACVGKSIVFL